MILVTGATGNVGKEVVSQLVAAGQPVRVFVRDASKVAHLDRAVERAVGDLDDPETFPAALAGVERIFLNTHGFDAHQDETMMAAAQRAGVQQVVKLSTAEAEDPQTLIGQWHQAKEQAIEASGIAWTFLRPGQFMSNTLQWADAIKEQGTVYFPGGTGQVAPIDPRDIAAVAVVALTQPGHTRQAYKLTGPELLTVGDQVAILARLLAKPLHYVDISPLDAAQWMSQGGMPPILVEAMVEIMTMVGNGQGAYRTALVEQLTGRPAYTYAQWCQAHLAAFQ